jgi:uncharacterized membrane protein YdjX (TVP38/TMEM64 family)
MQNRKDQKATYREKASHPKEESQLMKLPLQLRSQWVWITCLSVGLIILFIYLYNSQRWIQAVKLWDIFPDHHRLKEFIFSFGTYSPLAFILLQIIQVIVAPIPGGAIEFLGGYLFGVKAGLLYSMIGLTLGSWFAFSLAKIFEMWVVEKFVSPKTIKKFGYLVGHEGVILSFVLFLIPGFPKDALCYILGLTPMHLGIFLIISTIGRIPGTWMATLQGTQAFEHQYKLFLILSGVSALVMLVFYIYHEKIHGWIKKSKGIDIT